MSSLTDLARALADPTRLRILALLRGTDAARLGGQELAVGEVARVLRQSQPRVSRHVRILADAGLVTRRREGSWQFLTLADAAVIAPLAAAADAGATSADRAVIARDARRLATIRDERDAQAATLFAARAARWDALKALHAPDTAIEAMMRRLLGGHPVGRLVDVGVGTGRVAATLGPGARALTGIDRSPDMLRLARARLAALPIAPRLVQGDATDLPLADDSADTVVLHQLLHYLPRPERAIAEAARVLAPGGRLLIVDFAAHALDRLRHEAGHARLGFSDDQIARWCAAAGLTLGPIRTLPGAALTVTLWLAEAPPADIAAPPPPPAPPPPSPRSAAPRPRIAA